MCTQERNPEERTAAQGRHQLGWRWRRQRLWGSLSRGSFMRQSKLSEATFEGWKYDFYYKEHQPGGPHTLTDALGGPSPPGLESLPSAHLRTQALPGGSPTHGLTEAPDGCGPSSLRDQAPLSMQTRSHQWPTSQQGDGPRLDPPLRTTVTRSQ